MKSPIEELDRIEGQVRSGNRQATEEQHRRGKLTARERIDLFFDPGSFVEIGMFAQH
ncbi:MAG: methylmalonyl-CoA carboxyltransferase, partial [Deltaproteobacteria bacterium]|nr:methylmalonyl-CoA carboxyltransferase [Deltaproteobacteria bacterium]